MNQLAYRIGSLVTAGFLLSTLAGCNHHALSTESVAGVAIHGSITGGQQPVSASTIQLYAAATSGTGAASNPLLTKVITTSDGTSLSNANANSGNANNSLPAGSFTITGDYTCPSADTQVYLAASGGNPGLASGTNNPALELLVSLGSCGQLSATTSVQVNEVTTVGSIAALYPYMTAYNAVSSISSAASAMAESFSLANEYMNVAVGVAPGTALPAGYYASSTEINTLADAIASCVNSAGNTSSSSSCSTLFQAATPMSGTAPTDTVGALLNILANPTQNVGAIYNLSSANAPFMPSLNKAPTDWTLPILPVPAAPTFTPAAGTFAASQTVTVTSPTNGTTILYTTDGTTPTANSSTYTGPISIPATATLKAIAVNRVTGSVGSAKYTITGSPTAPTFSLASGSYAGPQLLAISSATADAKIYITTDGTVPTSSSTPYTSSLQIASPETVKAIAVAAGASSAVTSGFYIFSNSSGAIYTYAGGPATGDGILAVNARINSVYGVTVDANGNLYIADSGNNRIRLVTASTGIITTIAGTGTNGFSGDGGLATNANLNSPYNTAVDANGNVYIADSGNNRIRMVSASTGNISTIAGTGSSGSTGDGGLATSALLNSPRGIAFDGAGNLYIGDSGNYKVRMVAATTGIISTIAGTGVSGYTGDGGPATSATIKSAFSVAVDGSGNIFVADNTAYTVRKIAASTGTISTVAGNGSSGTTGDGGQSVNARLYYPRNVAVDAAGNLYIADSQNYRIRKVTAATGIISTVAGMGTTGFSGDGGQATSALLSTCYGVAIDPSGNIYIADSVNNRIRMVTASTGVITTVAGTGTSGYALLVSGLAATASSLYSAPSAAMDANGNLYVADTSSHRVRRIDGKTGIMTTFAGVGVGAFGGDGGPATSANLYSPSGVALDASGNVFISDTSNQRIRRVDASTGIITTIGGTGTSGAGADGVQGTSSNLYFPRGMVVDSSGNVIFADANSNRVRKITVSSGIISTVAGTGAAGSAGDGGAATSAGLNNPWSVALDGAGNLYIADASNHRVRMVLASSGVIATVAGVGTSGSSGDGAAATAANLNYPRGVAVDSSGNIYIADTSNNRVRKVTASSGLISTVAGTGTAGFSGDGASATAATLTSPYDVVTGANGTFYIVDQGNSRIRVVYP